MTQGDGMAEVTEADRLKDRCVIDENGCWVWQGNRDARGYGRVGRRARVHRVMYELENGPIPAGLELDHTCENPPCINPVHLDAITRLEHVRRTMDRLGKNHLHRAAAEMRRDGHSLQEIADALGWKGEGAALSAIQNAVRKGLISEDVLPKQRFLTQEDRDGIVAMRQSGAVYREIAEAYGISLPHAHRVAQGKKTGRAA